MSAIGVVGAGYVGLTTAACLASMGHDVICGDSDIDKIGQLARGEVPFHEAGLPELVADSVSSGNLRFVPSAGEAAAGAEFVFICVPTPEAEGGGTDLSAVDAVAAEIASTLRPGSVVVNKSTMPVGSTARVARILGGGSAPDDVAVASNPEFLREGSAVHNFLHPTRIVIGTDDAAVAERVADVYTSLHVPIVLTDPASAELIKLASNAFLASKISFINAVANICDAVHADIRDVSLGMGSDPRIGSEFLHAGPGWGGPCFPKDAAALLRTATEAGYDFELLRGAIEDNDQQQLRIVDKIREANGGSLSGARIAVLGLTFKASTDDLRNSPAVAICREIVAQGATVCAYDPAAGVNAVRVLPEIEVVPDPYTACAGASVLAVLTEWDEFRLLDFERVGRALAAKSLVDAHNMLDHAELGRLGFDYRGVGR